ncbi:MAG TPA: hypothetical protein VHL57_04865, partial [Flavobacteriales bacterium]|nr:hypothetical protein [Flavobacteriales bacterium]
QANGTVSFRTENTGTEPLHLLVTAWTKGDKWRQNRIMNTSKEIRVRGLKYYEFDFDGWNAVEQVAARVIARFRKER